MTPDELRAEIMGVIRELRKAPATVRDLEVAAEQAELDYEKAIDKAFLIAEGNVEERKAQARARAEDLADLKLIARAEYNRAKLKVKQLEGEQMGLQSVLKSIQLEGA